MKTSRVIAAAAALVVTGSAFAAPPTDNGGGSAATPLFTSNVTDLTYDLSTKSGIDGAFSVPTTPNLNRGGFAPGPSDNGTIWVLTDLSYELPSSSNTTIELGFGWYGVGGGINIYPDGGHHGLMWDLRVGFIGDGVAVNGGVNYVGHISNNLMWRVGVGVEYDSATAGFWHSIGSVFPIGILDIGFRL